MKKNLLSLMFALSALTANAVTINYSTFLGGNGNDYNYDIDVTDNGQAVVTGRTSSSSFPTTTGSYNPNYNGGSIDVFVTKLTADGSSLNFSTFLGGSNNDAGHGVMVDENGNAYVTGFTQSTNFPTQNAFDSSHNGNADAFLTKVNSDGSNLNFSTFLGGSSADESYAITLENGNAFVTGITYSSDFPTQNAFDPSYIGNGDAFVTKFSASGNLIEYSTFIGGLDEDRGYGIAIENGNIFLTGFTQSTNFPTQNAYASQYNGGSHDAFVTKFSTSGNTLEFSTFLGGTDEDIGTSIKVENGNAFLVGHTKSSNFPTQNAYSFQYNGGSHDAFVTKFSTSGNTLEFSTFLGGTGDDRGRALTVENGKVFITGSTYSSDFPTQNATDPDYNGSEDLFITQINNSTLEFSTFLGGGSLDAQESLGSPSIFKNGSLFLSAFAGAGFPSTSGSFDDSFNGNSYDAVVVRYDFPTVGIVKFENPFPSKFKLEGNYPNPFNPTTKIKFSLEEQVGIKLTIFNLNGKFVKELVSGKVGKGSHTAIWDGTDSNGKAVASGIYISRLESERISISKKLTLLK